MAEAASTTTSAALPSAHPSTSHSPTHSAGQRALHHFLAGAVGGSAAATILSPLDILRTRMQSVAAASARVRPDDLAMQILRHEGVRGFYRGLVPTIIGVGPSRALYFGAFSYAKRVLGREGVGLHGTPLHLLAASAAGMFTNTCMSPWWVIRLRLQLQATPPPPLSAKIRAWWQHTVTGTARSTVGAVAATEALSSHAGSAAVLGVGSDAVARVVPPLDGRRASTITPGSNTARHAGTRAYSIAAPVADAVRTSTRALGAALHTSVGAVASTGASASVLDRARAGVARNLATAATIEYPSSYTGVVDCAVKLYREEGIRAFYRGLTASYLGVIETALQFGLYNYVKSRIVEHQTAKLIAERQAILDAGGEVAPVTSDQMRRMAYTDAWAFGASSVTKLFAAAATYPHEVIRTRMREQHSKSIKYTGILNAIQTIIREEGVRGLYGGMSIHLLRTVPNAAILLVVVEKLVGGDL